MNDNYDDSKEESKVWEPRIGGITEPMLMEHGLPDDSEGPEQSHSEDSSPNTEDIDGISWTLFLGMMITGISAFGISMMYRAEIVSFIISLPDLRPLWVVTLGIGLVLVGLGLRYDKQEEKESSGIIHTEEIMEHYGNALSLFAKMLENGHDRHGLSFEDRNIDWMITKAENEKGEHNRAESQEDKTCEAMDVSIVWFLIALKHLEGR